MDVVIDEIAGAVAHARPFQRAEIIAVGSELLMPPRLDTNSLILTEALNGLGIPVLAKAVVGDRVEDVADLVRPALGRADLVVLTGGLGPTDDDVTREAVARVLDRRTTEDPAIVDKLRARFASRGLTMPEINRRQAQIIEGAVVLDNTNGTAPGQWIEVGSRALVLLPGPPRELKAIVERLVAGPLAARAGGLRLVKRTIFVTGMTESHAEEALLPYYERWRGQGLPIEATILAAPGQIELHLIVRARPAEGTPVLEAAVADVERALGDRVFSTSGRRLEEVVGAALAARGWRIALAESCTGGLTASRLTDIPGSSAYVEAAIVAYSNAAKSALLSVPAELIAEWGAVSEPVAVAMAEGARRVAGTEVGVGITGIAGPTGGTEAKPVGTVAIAVVTPAPTSAVHTFRFPGGRTQVKFFASQSALDMVRRAVRDAAPPHESADESAHETATPRGGAEGVPSRTRDGDQWAIRSKSDA